MNNLIEDIKKTKIFFGIAVLTLLYFLSLGMLNQRIWKNYSEVEKNKNGYTQRHK